MTTVEEVRKIMNETNYCYKQLIGIAIMLKGKIGNAKVLGLQFGYNLGRLVTLLLKQNLIYRPYPLLSGYTRGMAKAIIQQGLPNTDERLLVDFGFAIGFMQEELNQSSNDWWIPISEFPAKEKWNDLVNTVQCKLACQKLLDPCEQNYISAIDHDGPIDWSSLHDKLDADYKEQQNIDKSLTPRDIEFHIVLRRMPWPSLEHNGVRYGDKPMLVFLDYNNH